MVKTERHHPRGDEQNQAEVIPKAPGIYLLTCTATGDTYIGQATNLNRRCRSHVCDLRNGCHLNRNLVALYVAHGHASLSFRVLLQCEQAELSEMERRCVALFSPSLNINKPPSRILNKESGKHGVPVTLRIDSALMNEVMRISDTYEFPPTITDVIEAALADFVAKKKTELDKKDKRK